MAPTPRKIVKMDFFRKGNNYVSPRDNWREENNYGASSTWYLFYSFLFLFFFFFFARGYKVFEKLSWRVTGFVVIFSKDDIKFSRCFLFFFFFGLQLIQLSFLWMKKYYFFFFNWKHCKNSRFQRNINKKQRFYIVIKLFYLLFYHQRWKKRKWKLFND